MYHEKLIILLNISFDKQKRCMQFREIYTHVCASKLMCSCSLGNHGLLPNMIQVLFFHHNKADGRQTKWGYFFSGIICTKVLVVVVRNVVIYKWIQYDKKARMFPCSGWDSLESTSNTGDSPSSYYHFVMHHMFSGLSDYIMSLSSLKRFLIYCIHANQWNDWQHIWIRSCVIYFI